MALNASKCNHLTPLRFKGLSNCTTSTSVTLLTLWAGVDKRTLREVGLTEAAVGDVADPVVVLAREVPCLEWIVTPDHCIVACSTKPRVGRQHDVRTAYRYKVITCSKYRDEIYCTSNVTGRHRGPKRKLRAGYRAPSLKQTSYVATRFHRRVWYRALSLCYAVFDIRASASSIGYRCAKCRFCRTLHCWASPWRKIAYSITHSVTPLIWWPGNRSFCFGISHKAHEVSLEYFPQLCKNDFLQWHTNFLIFS